MTFAEVKKLITKDETRTLELKKTTGELHRGMETACAFLNSDGGWLIFGVAPNLKITGQNVTDATRQDTLTVPFTAIKEAAINMLCHRSWNADNLTPSLAIYNNRMVFQNPGAFPAGMSWKDFVDDSIGSMPNNPTIANVFYRRGTMESWGRGISLIMESCREQGLPEPEIEIVPNFVNLTIWFRDLLSAQDSPQDTPTHPNTPQVAPQVRRSNHHMDVSAVQNKIIEFCHTPHSVAEIAEMLGVKDKKWVKDKYMKPILGTKLALTIPDRPNSRYQKYQTIENN